VFLLGLLTLAMIIPSLPVGASDTTVRWESFSESPECGEPYTRPPMGSRSGSLPYSEPILGPYGTYFGRTITQVRSRLVLWTVPGSGGQRILVHKSILPALQRVSAGLAAEAAAGRVYPITRVSSFAARTVSGTRQISRHAMAASIDINYPQNPYRADGKLITNIPDWFAQVWRDAGFCWGGDWRGSKDPMHFSWIGPKATPGTNDPLPPIPPLTTIKAYGPPVADIPTIFGPVMDRYGFMTADGDGNGSPDVVGLRTHPDGAVLDIALGARNFGSCSIARFFLPDPSVLGAEHTLFVDIDGDSRQDLVTINGSQAVVATRRDDYEDLTSKTTSLDPNAVAVTGGDFDGDHHADLWAVSPDGTLRVFGGDSWDVLLHEQALPNGAPQQIAVGDRDGGNIPEVFALYPAGSSSRVDVLRLNGSWQLIQGVPVALAPAQVTSMAAADYDGDGRADLEIFDSQGRLKPYLGNSSTGRPASGWFVDVSPDCSDPVRLVYTGSFFDDDSSVHVNGIEAMAAAGITKGCNPPFNDKFCPERVLTRAEAATLLARALSLPNSGQDYFSDDNGHVLEGGINRLAEAGITKGCNPPANDRFCPNRPLSRAEFAAFISRALSLPAASRDYFSDDKGNVLEGAINRIAEAGITKGCNPPANTHFCPASLTTRAETATFLTRALG
jgi:hypothetical protein